MLAAVPDGGFSAGLVGQHQDRLCITSIKAFAKCLTTDNIPLPPANPIDVLAFVTLPEKQSRRRLAPVRRRNGETLVKLTPTHTPPHTRLIQTHTPLCWRPDEPQNAKHKG